MEVQPASATTYLLTAKGPGGNATARTAAALAPIADLNSGAARTALRKAVQAAQTGDPR